MSIREADWGMRVKRVAFVGFILLIGMGIGGWLGGGFQSDAVATEGVGPNVGEIRIGADQAGPTETLNGVGIGFERSERGALAAATNMVLTIEQAGSVDRDEAIQAYETLAAEASRASLAAEMEASWDSLHQGIANNGPLAPSLFLRTVPVGHEMVRYSPERATVDIWTLTLLAADGLADPFASWETATIELVWEGGDWKVWSASSAEGPTPAWSSSEPSPTESFIAEVTNLEGFRYVAN